MKQRRIIETPLGNLLAIAEGPALLSLQFTEEEAFKDKTPVLLQLEKELHAYFASKLKVFRTPLHFSGTDFQKKVWNELKNVPYGKTLSYKELAEKIDHKKAVRAVANANGANPFIILIPCHRILYADGTLGGYSSGLSRKKWLLEHENIRTCA